jgi:hypothetical protein
VDAPIEAVLFDSSLTHALARDDIGDPELQAQQVVAQLAVIQDEAPDQTRGVVFGIAAGVDFSSQVVAKTLELLESHPLVLTSTVAEVFDDVDPAREPDAGPVVVRELTPGPAPDLGAYPDRFRATEGRIDSFAGVLRGSEDLVASWRQRLLVSGATELEPQVRDRYLTVVDAGIDTRVAQIESPVRQTVTLTSREGVIPFTIRNELPRPVDLVLELQAGSSLEFPGGENRAITVEPGSRQIRVPVKTLSPGVIPVTVRVTSPDGGLLFTSSRVTVRSTAVSGLGYVLSIGAALFLVVWWFRHWRRARRARHAAVT